MKTSIKQIALLLFFFTLQNLFAQSTMVIYSDASWRANNVLISGWDSTGFNDAGWVTTVSPRDPSINCGYSGGTVAPNNMWMDNHTTSSGSPDRNVYLRKTFNLTNIPTSAFLKAIFDDNGAIYINGHQVYDDHDNTIVASTDTIPVNVLPYLTCGQNVIAIHAWDGQCCCWFAECKLTIISAPATINANAPTTFCEGNNVVLSTNTGIVSSAYAWSNGTTSIGTTPTITVTSGGNYNVILTGANGCLDTASIAVTVNPTPVALITGDTNLCAGASTTFTASASGGGGGYNYAWLPNGTGNTAAITVSPATPTKYIVNISDSRGCVTADSINVSVLPSPVATFTVVSDDCSTLFKNTSSGAVVYQWNFGDETSSTDVSPTHVYISAGDYMVKLLAKSPEGCMDTASQSPVSIAANGSSLFVPNTFTPNGDNLNDQFKIVGSGLGDFSGMIFNRWGEIVFRWNNPNEGWDGTNKGKNVPAGIYTYSIKAKLLCGGKGFEKNGMVTLLR